MQVVPFAFETRKPASASAFILELFGSPEASHDALRLVLLAQQGLYAELYRTQFFEDAAGV